MVKKLKDGKASIDEPINKAKNFFWKILTLIFSLLFITSIVVCALFATGIIAIVEDEESGAIRLRYESPLAPKKEEKQASSTNRSEAPNNTPTSVEEFNGDNIGWDTAIDKICEEDNSTCAKSYENLPSIAGYDLDLSGLLHNANVTHPSESLEINDIRFTSNGRYVVARIVSNLVKDTNVIVNELYFYRSTYNSRGWSELKSLGNNQVFDCTQLTDIQKMIVEDVYSERGCVDNNNY